MIPLVGKTEILEKLLAQDLTIKLFSNNVTPADSDTAATYTEVAGGGYSSKTLTGGSWTIVDDLASYAQQEWDFTDATDAPGTIYGYYIVNGSNVLIGVERFPSGVLPFEPVDGSTIKITPKIQD